MSKKIKNNNEHDSFWQRIQDMKDERRKKDLEDLKNGVSVEEIMLRNSAIKPESAKKAKIKFGSA